MLLLERRQLDHSRVATERLRLLLHLLLLGCRCCWQQLSELLDLGVRDGAHRLELAQHGGVVQNALDKIRWFSMKIFGSLK